MLRFGIRSISSSFDYSSESVENEELPLYSQQSEDDQSEPGSLQGGRRESNPSPSKPGYRRNGSLPSVFSTNGNTDMPSKLNRTPSNPQSPHSYITKKESQDSSVSAHSNSSGNIYVEQMSRVMRKPTVWFPNRSDTNRSVQAQKMARGWKFWI